MTRFKLGFSCDQKWSSMEVVKSDVRHCASCEKNVFDVTGRTEKEIEKLFRKNGDSLCVQGWFRESEGDLMLVAGKRRLPVVSRFVAAAAVSLAACAEQPLVSSAGLSSSDDDSGQVADGGADGSTDSLEDGNPSWVSSSNRGANPSNARGNLVQLLGSPVPNGAATNSSSSTQGTQSTSSAAVSAQPSSSNTLMVGKVSAPTSRPQMMRGEIAPGEMRFLAGGIGRR